MSDNEQELSQTERAFVEDFEQMIGVPYNEVTGREFLRTVYDHNLKLGKEGMESEIRNLSNLNEWQIRYDVTEYFFSMKAVLFEEQNKETSKSRAVVDVLSNFRDIVLDKEFLKAENLEEEIDIHLLIPEYYNKERFKEATGLDYNDRDLIGYVGELFEEITGKEFSYKELDNYAIDNNTDILSELEAVGIEFDVKDLADKYPLSAYIYDVERGLDAEEKADSKSSGFVNMVKNMVSNKHQLG